MNKVRFSMISSSLLLLSVGAVGYAQEPPAQPPPQQERQRNQDEGTPAKLRGCLTKGTQAQEYVIADETSGEKVSFAGSNKLDTYVNQTVELTGQIVAREGGKAFVPQALKPISTSCKSAPEK